MKNRLPAIGIALATVVASGGTATATHVATDAPEASAAAPLQGAASLDCPALQRDPRPPYWVCHAGSRRTMFETGDLSASIDLALLDQIDALYAIGPIEGLKGEISVVEGRGSIATIEEGVPVYARARSGRAIFLVYGAAAAWQPVAVSERLAGLKEVEAFVRRAAGDLGMDQVRAPFPFRVDATPERLAFHIIYRDEGAGDANGAPAAGASTTAEPDAAHASSMAHAPAGHAPAGHAPAAKARGAHDRVGHQRSSHAPAAAAPAHAPSAHDRAAHRRAMKSFTLPPGAAVHLFGFVADAAGEGVYTHDGTRLHLHFVATDADASGHVDDLVVPAGATLYLPKPLAVAGTGPIADGQQPAE